MSLQLANAEELEELRQWLSKIPYLPIHLCDDDLLQRFYIHRKGNIADTKQNIVKFFKNYMLLSKDLCILDMNDPGAKKFAKITHDFILPTRAKDGTKVVYQYMIPPFMKNVTMQSIVQHRRRIWSIVWGTPYTEQKFTTVYSVKDHSLSLLLKHFNMEQYAAYVSTALKTLPYSVVAIHIIYVSPLIDSFSKKVMMLMSEKIRERVHFHSTLDTLYDYIPKENLPSDLGGDLPTSQELHDAEKTKHLEEFNERLLQLQNFFLENHGKHDDLLGESPNTDTFRKLEID